MDDDDLFVVVSWEEYSQCFTSILQLQRRGINHEYDPSTQEAPVVQSEFSVTFRLPLPPPRLPVQWGYALLTESPTEASLHMVPDWNLGAREEELHSCIFNLKTKKCKRVQPPHTSKYGGHVVSLGAHTYFFAQPCKDTNKAPVPVLERYDPLKDEWEQLEPIPQDFITGSRIFMGTIRATAVWDDTILLNLFESLFCAYNVNKNKWYQVMVNKPWDCAIEGEAFVIGDTIYALSPKHFASVAVLSINKKVVNNDDPVYKCSLLKIIKVLGEEDIEFDYADGCRMSRHLVHFGEDNFCLVHSCKSELLEEYQPIQLTYIKLKGKKSMIVTNKSVHHFKLEPNLNAQFEVRRCFSLPKHKTTDLKEGQTSFVFDPFPESFLSRQAPKDKDYTDIDLVRELGKPGHPSHASEHAASTRFFAARERSNTDKEGHSICVVKLSSEATVSQLVRELKIYGPIMKVQINVPTNATRKPCAYVEFENEAAKRLAIEASPITIGGRRAVIQNIGKNDNWLTALPTVSSKALTFVPRPNLGTCGKHSIIKANHFRVDVGVKYIHHYDVKITPEVLSKTVCRRILLALYNAECRSHFGMQSFAYDGRNSIYTAGPLPFESQDFDVVLSDSNGSKSEQNFHVKLTFAAQIDLHQLPELLNQRQRLSLDTIQALNVVFHDYPSYCYSPVGRSLFPPGTGCVKKLGREGLDCWHGFYQSLRQTQMGLSLNIDISARPLYEPILVTDFIVKCLKLRGGLRMPLSEPDRHKVIKALRGVRVEITHPDSVRKYKITGLSTQPLNKLTFSVGGSGHKFVTNYFREKYNIVLQYGHLPALQAGNDARPAYLPMEVCKIVEGQRYAKKLNEKQVSAMLKATCERPADRESRIKKIAHEICDKGALLKQFGIFVSRFPTPINARVLKPPMLKYHQNGTESRVNPRVGQWNMNNKKMIDGGLVDVWACVNFSNVPVDVVYGFCRALLNTCYEKGMVINPEPAIPIESDQARNAEKLLCQVHGEFIKLKKQLQLLIVILPEMSGLYGTIKRVCETELGIVSQCCQPKHLASFDKQYLENVALKINVKVGGTNLHLDVGILRPRKDNLTDMPTIVFGADVTHPQPGDDSSSSIAAVVASMDWPHVTKYRCLVSAQSHRQEIIQDLYTCSDEWKIGGMHGGMIREHLIAHYQSTGRKPSRIIFYRDGVSEGQFSQVLLHEVDSIRKACQSLQEGYLPRITFVVVQKRHHTRLFASDHTDRFSTVPSGNILPGTVVDTDICHPTGFDFYLCSHAGIKGTSRPTHYHVLFDENEFSADELQVLTNNLCYTYARCTRSVSVVPPVFYAHLAAFRARHYVEGMPSDVDSSLDGRSGGKPVEQTVVRRLPDIKDNVKKVMFYC